MNSSDKIREVADKVRDLLLEKNKAYGDSALKPINVFARGTAVENLSSRIDDKISRIKNKGIDDKTEDTLEDLIGYLILLKIAIQDERNNLSESIREEAEFDKYWSCSSTYTIRKE
jgi:hypothetical protein